MKHLIYFLSLILFVTCAYAKDRVYENRHAQISRTIRAYEMKENSKSTGSGSLRVYALVDAARHIKGMPPSSHREMVFQAAFERNMQIVRETEKNRDPKQAFREGVERINDYKNGIKGAAGLVGMAGKGAKNVYIAGGAKLVEEAVDKGGLFSRMSDYLHHTL